MLNRTRHLQRLLRFLAPYRLLLGAAIGAVLVSALLALLIPLLFRDVVNAAFVDGNAAALNRAALLLIGVLVVRAVSSAVETYLLHRVSEQMTADVRVHLFEHLLRLSLPFFDNAQSGELVSRLTNDIATIQQGLTTSITALVLHTLRLVGAVVILFWLNWRLAVLVLLVMPLVGLITRLSGRVLRRESEAIQHHLAEATAVAAETLANMRLVQAFGREAYARERFVASVQKTVQAALRRARMLALLMPTVGMLFMVAFVVVAWFAGRQALSGALTVGDVFAFFFYASLMSGSVNTLAGVYGAFQQTVGAAQRLFALLDTPPMIADTPNAQTLPPLRGEICFEHVSFAYNAQTPVLCEISLRIAPGEVVALVGPSGAGKTTLANLVLRLYEPTAGRILIDGYDIRTVTLASLRQQMALVPQDTILFAATVRENIRYGRLDATDAEVEAAAKAAYAHEFIMALPNGYETPVGERGVKLSGGQRQRIALARAILRNPRILILDEATSSLDSESETAIQQALARFLPGRTTILIAHRLSTVRIAHRILVLDGGRIVEEGDHATLLAKNGLYARLYRRQHANE